MRKGDVREVPDFQRVSSATHATYPYPSDAIWYLSADASLGPDCRAEI
ncbi:MAG: hypothetical protein MH208_19640 [Marinobacter sp.]|nr:hypothetical protein [Marinobacter sp.]